MYKLINVFGLLSFNGRITIYYHPWPMKVKVILSTENYYGSLKPPKLRREKGTIRHEKSSKPSADAILGYLKFPQIETFKFPQKPIICDQKLPIF